MLTSDPGWQGLSWQRRLTLAARADARVRGVRMRPGTQAPRILAYSFINRLVRPHDWSNLDAGEPYPWAAELTPVEQAVLHNPARRGHPLVIRADE